MYLELLPIHSSILNQLLLNLNPIHKHKVFHLHPSTLSLHHKLS